MKLRKGNRPKLNTEQIATLLAEYDADQLTVSQLATKYHITRATIYRYVAKARCEVCGWCCQPCQCSRETGE